MPKNVGYELADGSWSSDYKSGDKFVVCNTQGFSTHSQGDIVELTENNDGTRNPFFKTVTGGLNCHDDIFGDNIKGSHENWSNLKPYKEEAVKESPTFIERDTIVNLAVTGEELALIYWYVANTAYKDVDGLIKKLDEKFPHLNEALDSYCGEDSDLSYSIDLGKFSTFDYIVFTKPESENVRLAKEKVEQAKKALEDAERELANLVG